MANKNKKTKSSNEEDNEYVKIRELRIQEKQRKLSDLGVKSIVNSLKKKQVKQNTHARDVDFIPDLSDNSEEDYQQVDRSVVISKKQHRRQYISPMSMNRIANLMKIRRVVPPNVFEKVSSTSIVTKTSKRPSITMDEISKGNKGGAKRSMALVDEEDDEHDEIFQEGNRVDMEVNDVDQDDEYENMDDVIYTNNRHEIKMADHDSSKQKDNIQEQSQGPTIQKATGSYSKGKSISRRKRLHITSIVSNEHIDDHVDDDHVDNAHDEDH
ncbi:hypothetical protein M8C21_009052 [Ambrosia artemisiifolia]|uniref:Uncharacterized protein n=1 Tax=Ambrosia artemisiifolia TaxID=4212 RepID=A0AAD5CPQ5_AMBAR|nr:hypothetical protein M8C21_009052 [Ambrosia artemisiifolia]